MKFGLIIATKNSDNCNYNSLPAAGIGFLVGMINKELPQVEVILDQNIDGLIKKSPDIIGISAVTENYQIAIDLATEIKKRLHIPVIIGGIHITLLPLSIKSCFDLAVLGEGEFTIVNVLKSFINNNNTINYQDLKKIHGLYYCYDNEYIMTDVSDYIQDLDTLPTLPYDKLPFYNDDCGACIVGSRGCPYKCSFCASEKMFKKYRSYTVGRIMQDVKYFLKRGKTHIVFYDDLLVADVKRLTDLVIAIENDGINKSCSFSCQVRANRVTPEICMLLKRMGVVDVGIGLESFSDNMLRYYNKMGVTAEINQNALDLLHQYRINVNPSIIFGASRETKEDMLLTFRKIYINIKEGKMHSPQWGLLRPYPGTKIWRDAEEKGIVGHDMDFSRFNNWSSFDIYLCENVSKNDFMTLMEEWRTKITLLYHKKGLINVGSNFVINDRVKLQQNITWISQLIRTPGRKPEVGDEIILDATTDNYTMYHTGWYSSEEDHRWMSNKSTVTINSLGKNRLMMYGYIPKNVLDLIYEGKLLLYFAIDGKKSISYELTSESCEDGLFNVEIPIQNKQVTELEITSNKTFVPKEHGISDDSRSFSILVTKFETL